MAKTQAELWDDVHAQRAWGLYPCEQLVRAVGQRWGIMEPGAIEPGALRPHAPRAIDLGCGGGAQSLFLAEQGFRVVAVDSSAAAAATTNARAGARGLRISAARMLARDLLAMPATPVSLIVDVCTLQHLSRDEARYVAARARDWLVPGGLFFSKIAARGGGGAGRAPEGIEATEWLAPEVDALFSGYQIESIGREEFICRDRSTNHWIISAVRP